MAEIQYAGEFTVEECTLCTVGGLELDLLEQLTTVTIFEDIFKNSITGNISFVDTNNLTANASIVGQEKLRLVIVTPNAKDSSERTMAINFTDTPLHIYKVDSSINLNDRTKTFSLSFTTMEMVRNNRIRVSQSFKGEPVKDIIKTVVRSEEYLNSKKEFYYEETTNNFQIIAPNNRPFDFINNLSKRCLSKEYNFSPSFLFYETIKGYYFRTVDSMMDRKNPRMVFREVTPTDDPDNAVLNLTNILNYEIKNSTDTILQARAGMYSSDLLEVDIYNKKYTHHEFDYLRDYDKSIHVDEFNSYGSARAPTLSKAQDDFGNRITEYPKTTQYVQTTERDKVGGLFDPAFDTDVDYSGIDIWLQKRRSRIVSLETNITLSIKVPGNTTLQAGDIIGIILKNQTSAESALDPYLTGRYLITNLRHEFIKGAGKMMHELHIDCVRDTVQVPYPSSGVTALDGGKSIEEIIPSGSADPSDIVF